MYLLFFFHLTLFSCTTPLEQVRLVVALVSDDIFVLGKIRAFPKILLLDLLYLSYLFSDLSPEFFLVRLWIVASFLLSASSAGRYIFSVSLRFSFSSALYAMRFSFLCSLASCVGSLSLFNPLALCAGRFSFFLSWRISFFLFASLLC